MLSLFENLPFDNVKNYSLNDNNNNLTGYVIYNAEQKRRTQRNDLPQFYPDLPQKNTILFMLTHHGIMAEKCSLINQVKVLKIWIGAKIFL